MYYIVLCSNSFPIHYHCQLNISAYIYNYKNIHIAAIFIYITTYNQ